MQFTFVPAVEALSLDGALGEGNDELLTLLDGTVYGFYCDDSLSKLPEGDAVALVDFTDREVYVNIVDITFRLPTWLDAESLLEGTQASAWLDGLLTTCHNHRYYDSFRIA